MVEVLFPLAGGIGLFLVGMMLLSQGLTAFAGDALRRALMRFTDTPAKAFGSGAVLTLLVQSSTATTITLIGFVSAGLIPFAQAVGVVIGASLGSTGTGWLVAGLGLKLSIGFYTLPLIGVGALLRLFLPGRWGALGQALAGFGTLFVGLMQLQLGMEGVSDRWPIADLTAASGSGYWWLVLLGLAMTTIMQSSAAAVATTVTALNAGTVGFDQAAALVIGAAIGTTFTGALAAIGGTVAAKRTALAHVLFNLATGVVAVLLLPLFLRLIAWLQQTMGLAPGAFSLVAFHTLFIAVGVLLFLPWARRYAALIERLLPDRSERPSRFLDDTLLTVPGLAINATARALRDIALQLFAIQRQILQGAPAEHWRGALHEAGQSLEETQVFFARISATEESEAQWPKRLALMHTMDHLQRLLGRLHAPLWTPLARESSNCQRALVYVNDMLRHADEGLRERGTGGWLDQVEHDAQTLTRLLQETRTDLLGESGRGTRRASEVLRVTEALRWLERSAHHVWRIVYYLEQCRHEGRSEAPPPDPMA